MATSDKNKPNRFLYSARVDQAKPDTNKMLLNILKDEFPDDMYFSRDRLTPPTAAEAAFEANMDKETLRKRKKIQTAERNEKNVLDVNVLRDEYEGYEISKSIPTIDEDELDDLIDEYKGEELFDIDGYVGPDRDFPDIPLSKKSENLSYYFIKEQGYEDLASLGLTRPPKGDLYVGGPDVPTYFEQVGDNKFVIYEPIRLSLIHI